MSDRSIHQTWPSKIVSDAYWLSRNLTPPLKLRLIGDGVCHVYASWSPAVFAQHSASIYSGLQSCKQLSDRECEPQTLFYSSCSQVFLLTSVISHSHLYHSSSVLSWNTFALAIISSRNKINSTINAVFILSVGVSGLFAHCLCVCVCVCTCMTNSCWVSSKVTWEKVSRPLRQSTRH